MTIYILVYLIFIVAPIGTIVHEIGHAAGAKSCKANKVKLSVGSGKVVHCFSYKNARIMIHRLFFLGGMAYSERDVPYNPLERVWIAVCGPISNFLAVGVLYLFTTLYPNHYLSLLLLFNLWVAIVNTIPFQIKGKQSDGYTIYKALKQK